MPCSALASWVGRTASIYFLALGRQLVAHAHVEHVHRPETFTEHGKRATRVVRRPVDEEADLHHRSLRLRAGDLPHGWPAGTGQGSGSCRFPIRAARTRKGRRSAGRMVWRRSGTSRSSTGSRPSKPRGTAERIGTPIRSSSRSRGGTEILRPPRPISGRCAQDDAGFLPHPATVSHPSAVHLRNLEMAGDRCSTYHPLSATCPAGPKRKPAKGSCNRYRPAGPLKRSFEIADRQFAPTRFRTAAVRR